MATSISNGESGLSVRTKLNDIWHSLDLNEYNKDITDTAVDVFVYDTRKDSDGGAWRKRTQHTSWYNETLNTATRGSRKEFPAVAVIVAEAGAVTIYDGDNPDMPMWMVFDCSGSTNVFSNTSVSSIAIVNGNLVCGGDSYGVSVISFTEDSGRKYSSSTSYGTEGIYLGNVSERNSGSGFTDSVDGNVIVNATVNDVAMTVLPNAPIDASSGLPTPTIAVATDGGVSVIKDDGTVVDDTTFSPINTVTFGIDNDVFYGRNGYGRVYKWDYSADTSSTATYLTNATNPPIAGNVTGGIVDFGNDEYWASGGTTDGLNVFAENKLAANITSEFNTGWMNGDIKLATLSDTDDTNVTGSELVTNGDFATGDLTGWTDKSSGTGTATVNGSNQLELYRLDGSNVGWAQQAITTVSGSTYLLTVNEITDGGAIFIGSTDGGSDIYGASAASGINIVMFTATSTTTYVGLRGSGNGTTSVYDDVSVSLAEEDRSVNGNGLQVFGTVTKSAVATGADLVGYSGFSGSDYLEQPYNSDLDFGTGDFCYMSWVQFKTGNSYLFDRDATDGSGARFFFSRTGNTDDLLNASGTTLTGAYAISDAEAALWNHVAVLRRNGVVSVYWNGSLYGSGANTDDHTNTSAVLDIGTRVTSRASSTAAEAVALFRVSATAPSPEQIKKIYEDEKVLFQENAKAVLYGSSDAVTALAYDDSTELLHVGTSAGRSVFQGLKRVDNTTTAVGAAISASNGLVADE